MRRALALLPLLLASCGSNTVALELEFPSPDTFVRSETVRVFVVPLGEGQEGHTHTPRFSEKFPQILVLGSWFPS